MTRDTETDEDQSRPLSVAFVCVQNAGRSQMATAFAERESERRDLSIEIKTGGTAPADNIHRNVVAVMLELGIDLSHRTPRPIDSAELGQMDVVITMGCDASSVCPATMTGESRDWSLDDPADADLATTRSIRDEIEQRIISLFDELEEWDAVDADAT